MSTSTMEPSMNQSTSNKTPVQIKNITVIGAGTMGNGICHVFAQHGYNVSMMDVSQEAMNRAMATMAKNMDRQIAKQTMTEAEKEAALSRIALYTNMEEALKDADLVVEAATESIDLKMKIFESIDKHAPPHCILASNTSSISITRISSHTKRMGKVIGMHFMNPVPVMKLVEIINGFATDRETTNAIIELSKAIGKVPCVVGDSPGLFPTVFYYR